MKMKLVVLPALLAALVVVVKTAGSSEGGQGQPQTPAAERRGTIAWHVVQAKIKGKSRATLLPVEENAALVEGLEDALSQYTVVVAQPVDKKSYVAAEDSFVTWNKFKVLEVLSQPPAADCTGCLSALAPPADLLPLEAGEILIPTGGGSVTVDGVEVVSESSLAGGHFSPSQTYLLFIALDSEKGVGKLRMGSQAVFTVASNSIKSISPAGSPLKRDLEAQFGNSLSALREHLPKKL